MDIKLISIKNHMRTLVKKIKYHEHMFHVMGEQKVSSSVYDSWRKELEELEKDFPFLVDNNSPSFYVGEFPKGEKVRREVPMLSLKHSYNRNEIERFCNSFPQEMFIVEPKVDGVAIALLYKKGIINSISLRGNGHEGENISHLAEFIHHLPFYCSEDLEIRGEAYIPEEIECDNKRNLVAGYLRQKNPHPGSVHFIAYKLIGKLSSQSECLDYMNNLGFKCVPFRRVLKENVIEIAENFYKSQFSFEIDGVVIKVDNLDLNLGNTARYPKDAIAYKFSTCGVKSIIREIEWGISRSGILVPTCLFDKVKINGCSISKCYAHNKKNLEVKKIGRGAIVSIVRIGNVIPYIEQVLQEGEKVLLNRCPYCCMQITESEINYICSNENCEGILQERFKYFFKKLNINALGKKLILRFFQRDKKIFEMILQTISLLKEGKWINDKKDEQAFKNFQMKRKFINIEDIFIAVGIEGIATHSQLKKLYSSKYGVRKKNFHNFVSSHNEILQKILWELVN